MKKVILKLGLPLSFKAQFEQVETRQLCISKLVLAELYYGAACNRFSIS